MSNSVGAVYDRAFGPLACENCAVIDRAYSRLAIIPISAYPFGCGASRIRVRGKG